MSNILYKKMAGTAAVFLLADYGKASPVERDGMVWSDKELHLEGLPLKRQEKPMIATVLALEGLEDYDPASNGDIRRVEALNENFIYYDKISGWVQLAMAESVME